MPELPTDGWSLLLQRLPTGGAIYLNGRMVADLPTDSDAQRIRWRRPHLINLPTEFLRFGRNEALIFTSYGNGVHGVGAVEVGPTAELQPRYGQGVFRQPHAALDFVVADRAARGRLRRTLVPPSQREPVRAAGADRGLLGAAIARFDLRESCRTTRIS